MFKMHFQWCNAIFLVFTCGWTLTQGSSGDNGVRFEPQVAIVCKNKYQYYSQYMTETGDWAWDPTSTVTCVEEKKDILKFCKKSYPNRDITNIVESSKFVRVSNFCRQGHGTKCKTSIFVKPYRCLEGTFQSDALLVPEGCLFDHIHNQSRCWEFDEWNTTADQACQARRLNLKAFAMLLPCGIDVFSGVEFVCCPATYNNHGHGQATTVEEPLALPQVDNRAGPLRRDKAGQVPTAFPNQPEETTTETMDVATRDAYYSRFDPENEHEAFEIAMHNNKDNHRKAISKVMKEWSGLEERYRSLLETNPKRADEFKRRMTHEFQETVQKVEAENEAEKLQLIALHQQRIIANINEMKREALTCYTNALAQPEPNTHKVQKCLQRVLRALNKDRHHTVAHFKHLLNTDFEAAERERDPTVQHLADLDRMVNQTLNMLIRRPSLYSKIGQLMREYATALRSRDVPPPELTESATDKETESDEDDDELDYAEDEDEDDSDSDEEDPEDDQDDDSYDDDADTDAEQLPELPEENGMANEGDSVGAAASSDPPTPAETHTQESPVAAHARHHEFSHRESSFRLSGSGSGGGDERRGVYYTLAFAGVALMGAMVVGIMVLRRKSNQHPHNQGFIEVNQTVSPEERHVSNMQVNGYENPTYKYFEEK